MKEFVILSKIGKFKKFMPLILCPIGDGAYSEVYKVKRLSDGMQYALKKVSSIFSILRDS